MEGDVASWARGTHAHPDRAHGGFGAYVGVEVEFASAANGVASSVVGPF